MAKGGKGPLLVCDDLDVELIWKRLNAVKDLNNSMRETIRCTVTGAVERGLLVNLFGVKGFVPVSHVTKQEGQEWLAKEDLQVRAYIARMHCLCPEFIKFANVFQRMYATGCMYDACVIVAYDTATG